MFILYAVVFGLAVGLLLGGKPSRLAELPLRWQWVMLGGLLVQVVLFSEQVTSWIGDLGAPLYVASTVAVFGAVVANARIVGMPLVAYGAACNLAAIVANGGYMPADPAALAVLGKVAPTVYSNSSVVAHPSLWALTDIFALPTWVPFANVFSVGDVIIAIGVAFVVAVAMVRGAAGGGARRMELAAG